MPTNEFNTGSDWAIDLIDPLQGGVLSTFALLTGFTKQQDTQEVSSNALDGLVRRAHLPAGWSGSITYDRANRALDDYIWAREEAYYAGRVQPPCFIVETITEVDGSISQYRFEGVSFRLSAGGNAQGKDKVEMTVEFTASRRRRVI